MQAGFKMDEVLCLQNFFISITIESLSRSDDYFYPSKPAQLNFYPARPVAPEDGTGVKSCKTISPGPQDHLTGVARLKRLCLPCLPS